MSIVVLGTVAMDTVKTPFGKREKMLGGSAAHFSMSARLFTKVNLVAVVGKDFPPKYIDFLEKKGLILTSLIKGEGNTFQWEGQYEGDLNTAQTLDTKLGVLSEFKPVISEEQREIRYIFLANVDPDIQRHLLEKMHSPKLVGLDSMNFWIHHKRDSLLRLMKMVDIFVANDQEARSLSGETNLLKAAKWLRLKGPKIVLIKKGEHGVLLVSDRLIFSLPAYPTDKVIDPTGAGDTFAGGFMGYLDSLNKEEPDFTDYQEAMIYGTVLASFLVESFSTDRLASVLDEEIEARLIKFKDSL